MYVWQTQKLQYAATSVDLQPSTSTQTSFTRPKNLSGELYCAIEYAKLLEEEVEYGDLLKLVANFSASSTMLLSLAKPENWRTALQLEVHESGTRLSSGRGRGGVDWNFSGK